MSCTAYTCSLEFFESLVNDLLKIILTLEQVFGGAAKILLGTHVFHRGVPRFEFQLYFQSPLPAALLPGMQQTIMQVLRSQLPNRKLKVRCRLLASAWSSLSYHGHLQCKPTGEMSSLSISHSFSLSLPHPFK